jgi:hypothetical protein
MKKYTISLSVLMIQCCVFFSFPVLLTAQEVSRDEFVALAQRVEQLEESFLHIVKNNRVEEIADQAIASMPMTKADKDSLIESIVTTIQAREESANFPWMDADKWSKLQKGMSPEEVISVLDEPTLNEPSMHKRIDIVYTYEGRRVATAKKVTGIVRFYKGEVVEIEIPEM